MKKVLVLILLLIVACGSSSEETSAEDTTTTTVQDTTTTTSTSTTTTSTSTTTTTIAKNPVCVEWLNQSEKNLERMTQMTDEFMATYIDYKSENTKNLTKEDMETLASNLGDEAEAIYSNQTSLEPNAQNLTAHKTLIFDVFEDYTYGFTYFEGWFAEREVAITFAWDLLGETEFIYAQKNIKWYREYTNPC